MIPKIIVSVLDPQKYPDTVYSTDCFVLSYKKLGLEKRTQVHYHNSYELEFLLDGCLENYINTSKHICNPGDCWLVFPNNFHQLVYKSEQVVLLSIKFSEKAIVHEVVLKLQQFISGAVSTLQKDDLDFILEDIDRAFVTLSKLKDESCKDIITKCLLSQMLVKLLDANSPDNKLSDGERCFPEGLYDSIKYIKDNFTQKLSRDEIAAKFGFSCSYYSAIFKKCTGKNFTDFVLGEKMDYAYYLLLSTKMTIMKIAEDAGFESPAYFSKAFKKAYGQSPSAVRESMDTFSNT